MKYIMKRVFGLICIACLSCCASKAQITEAFPQEIENVYFQKWIGGQELTGTGTNFFIELKQTLSKLIATYFHQMPNSESNKESAITKKPKYNLLPNEAVIEYAFKNNNAFLKIVTIKEKELIAYPSSRPRN
jgi:hypothetical protein